MPSKKGTKTKKTKQENNLKAGKADRKKNKISVNSAEQMETEELSRQDSNSLKNQILPYVIAVFAIFLSACMAFRGTMGFLGDLIGGLLFGLFSWAAVFIPLSMLIIAYYWRKDAEKGRGASRFVYAMIVLVCLSVLGYAFAYNSYNDASAYVFSFEKWWEDGLAYRAGGAIGGFIGFCLHKVISFVGTLILCFPVLAVFVMLMFDFTPYSLILTVRYKLHKHAENIKNEKNRFDEEYKNRVYRGTGNAESDTVTDTAADEDSRGSQKYNPDVSLDEDEIPEEGELLPVDQDVFNRLIDGNPDCITYDSEVPPFDAEGAESVVIGGSVLTRMNDGRSDLKKIFDDSDILISDEDTDIDQGLSSAASIISDGNEFLSQELEIERKSAVDNGKVKNTAEPKKPVYKFPPISLLQMPKELDAGDCRKELQETSLKLVKTLESFKVKTKVSNISRGPTITRYELVPEEGVRVRAITNLVDDISLSLAATGVRIEAPIPGKQAVGIEVPNKLSSTVYIRKLIDSPKFKQAQSKIYCALGEDVAGEPIYLDIAKMPHLLIAGATGMGKSVCINGLIVSMLYKASPEDLKLLLIDPKKVEFNLYCELPHLLMPPVSDSKRAAGALQWAVIEMERRYSLIEDVGVRNITGYNQAIVNDPEREHLPQIVVIIDELADLMMSSADIVEESICRLAQKARAAGIHLVIGTQSPRVDVVTGLIKANIPSRIAFTVSSITDSRVILDYGGAEKLIGRGDMLYAPVGASKPIRVQGAFVSDEEVDSVVNYIKDNFGSLEYDMDIVEEIDQLAQNCDGKKGGSFDGNIGASDAEDPMLKPAIELAVESGKISTSLIQRKLSLGYGRAAKLIDEMENRGIVSAPEGQKPRTVLLSKQEYMEMILRNSK